MKHRHTKHRHTERPGIKRRFVHIIGIVAAVTLVGLAPTLQASLAGRIDRIIQSKAQRGNRFSIHVVHAETGRTLYAHQETTPRIPASNMKLIATAAALHYLGADYEYKTEVALLDDSLAVIGYGDPLLGDERIDPRHGRQPGWIFDDIVAALKEHGITTLQDIYVDGTFFDRQRIRPSWPADQLNRWYCAEISGLNYNDNCIRIEVRNRGSHTVVELDPPTRYVTVVNQVKATSRGASAVEALRTSRPNRVIVRGTCRTDQGFWLAIEDPTAFFGVLLYERLRAAGITIRGKLAEKYVRHDKRRRVIRTYPTPIRDVLERSNKNSLQVAAECLVKTISAENTVGRINGEWPHGLKLIERYLAGLGIPSDQVHLDDGSGMSRENRLTATAVTAVLLDRHRADDWPVFRESLAVGGVDGTLDDYFREPPYKGKIRGKTGYLSGVRSLSGYAETPNGTVIFSILTEYSRTSTWPAIRDIAKAVFDEAK